MKWKNASELGIPDRVKPLTKTNVGKTSDLSTSEDNV